MPGALLVILIGRSSHPVEYIGVRIRPALRIIKINALPVR